MEGDGNTLARWHEIGFLTSLSFGQSRLPNNMMDLMAFSLVSMRQRQLSKERGLPASYHRFLCPLLESAQFGIEFSSSNGEPFPLDFSGGLARGFAPRTER